jgi:hypothetical protein
VDKGEPQRKLEAVPTGIRQLPKEQGQPMNYEALKATAQSLQELCKELIADIDNGVLNPEAIHFYLHDLETGDNSIYSALELELEETEGN